MKCQLPGKMQLLAIQYKHMLSHEHTDSEDA